MVKMDNHQGLLILSNIGKSDPFSSDNPDSNRREKKNLVNPGKGCFMTNIELLIDYTITF
jgi:hypothetical protein